MNRLQDIIKILLNSKVFTTIDEIAEKLKVSNKTIRNDLKKVEELLSETNLVLEKKPSSGVCINGSEVEKLNFLDKIKATKNTEPFSNQDRKEYILKRLFMSNSNVTTKELADELYVSRVTIHKELEKVEEWLLDYDLSLIRKQNYGIQISGSEECWRNAVINLVMLNKGNNELRALLYENYNSRIDYKTLMKLKELLDIDYKALENILCLAEEKMKFKLSDDAFISLIIHIAISIKRLNQKKDIILHGDVLKKIEVTDEFKVASEIAEKIEELFNAILPKDEVGYIALHILGAKTHEINTTSDVKIWEDSEEELSMIMAIEMIKIAENAARVSLSEDKQLLNALILHLRPTINRLKYGLTLRNPMLDEIEKSYTEAYGIAWLTTTVFKKYLGENISKEEVGYIAIHFAAGIERQKRPLKTLVVCTSGIGTSQLVAVKLEKRFKQLEIIDVVSFLDLKKFNLDEIEIIISTVPIKSEKPILIITPLLNEKDIRKIEIFLNNTVNKDKRFSGFTSEDLIEINAKYKNKEELLKAISTKLINGNFVKEEFYKKVLEREKQYSTEVGNGVAIPHSPLEYVNTSIVAYVKLYNPIKWETELVDTVIFICVAQEDVSKFKPMLRNLYNSIDDSETLEKLKKCNNKEKIVESLEVMFSAN